MTKSIIIIIMIRTDQVPHVVHGLLVGVDPHGGLQVVNVDHLQVALPQLPAAALLHLHKEHRGQEVSVWILATLALAPYLRLVRLAMRLLPQLPVDVQRAVKHGRRAGAQQGTHQQQSWEQRSHDT